MFRNMRDDTKTSARTFAQVVIWAALLGMLLLCVSVAYLKVWPTLRGMWFEGMRSGNEYITTQETMLFTMYADYQDLEAQIALSQDKPAVVAALEAQQEAILERMIRSAASIEGHVPPEIARFLAAHQGG